MKCTDDQTKNRLKMYKRKSLTNDCNDIRQKCKKTHDLIRQSSRDNMLKKRRNSDASNLFPKKFDQRRKKVIDPNKLKSNIIAHCLRLIVTSRTELCMRGAVDQIFLIEDFSNDECILNTTYDCDVVHKLYQLLSYTFNDSNITLKLLNIICTISAVSSQFTQYLAQVDMSKTINLLLLEKDMKFVAPCVTIIGNIMVDVIDYRISLASSQTLQYIILSANKEKASYEHIMRVIWICYIICWTIDSCNPIKIDETKKSGDQPVYNKPQVNQKSKIKHKNIEQTKLRDCSYIEVTIELIVALIQAFIDDSIQMAELCLGSLIHIISFSRSSLKSLIQNGTINKAVEWLHNKEQKVEIAALHVIGELTQYEEYYINYLLRYGLIKVLQDRLNSDDHGVVEACLYISSNLFATNNRFITCYIELKLTNFMLKTTKVFLQESAELTSWALLNFTINATDGQLLILYDNDSIGKIFFLLSINNPTVISCILSVLKRLVEVADRKKFLGYFLNAIKIFDAFSIFEKLHNHSSHIISSLSKWISQRNADFSNTDIVRSIDR